MSLMRQNGSLVPHPAVNKLQSHSTPLAQYGRSITFTEVNYLTNHAWPMYLLNVVSASHNSTTPQHNSRARNLRTAMATMKYKYDKPPSALPGSL